MANIGTLVGGAVGGGIAALAWNYYTHSNYYTVASLLYGSLYPLAAIIGGIAIGGYLGSRYKSKSSASRAPAATQ